MNKILIIAMAALLLSACTYYKGAVPLKMNIAVATEPNFQLNVNV